MSLPSASQADAADQISDRAKWRLGRYELLSHLATGGMSEIYLARVTTPPGEGELVAVKVLPAHLASEPAFLTMFLDEARLAARIRHPNVVATLDVQATAPDACFLAMQYVQGDHLGTLLRDEAKQHRRLPMGVTLSIVLDALRGLGAAHRLTDERGTPLHLVHRDVTPHNIMVGTDGVARLMDFGVAKARGRSTATQGGQLKGKLGYMAPEYATTGQADARSDLFAMGVVLWESLTACRLFRGSNEGEVLAKILQHPIPPPSQRAPEVAAFDAVVLAALARDPAQRFATAEEFITALEAVAPAVGGVASPYEVAQLVERVAGPKLHVERAIARRPPPQAAPASGSVGLDAVPSLAVGDVVDGRYRIEGVLGQGANGVVYSATHTTLRRKVALKVLRVDHAQRDSMVGRFLQEAQSTSTMEHPHIVDITDFGHLPDQRPYFVMEQLVGCTLRERLRQGPMEVNEALRVVQQVASGLGAAHARHVIHRDLKPENIFLVTRDHGERWAKVLDFGVAKITNAPHKTQTGIVYGTPQYMSPEQGSGDKVDTRTDIYALGVILFEMLTGEAPFTGDTFMAVVHQHRTAALPPHPRVTGAHPQLFGVLQRALAKVPGERYQDMAAFSADLERCVVAAGPSSQVRSAAKPVTTRAQKGVPRAALYAAGLAAGALGLAALGVALDASGVWQRGRELIGEARPSTPSRGVYTVPIPVTQRPAPAAPAPVPTPVAAAPELAAQPADARAPVQITSVPAGAMVQQNGASIGNTPLDFWLPSGESQVRLTITLADHEDAVALVTPTSPATIEVQLRARSSSSRSSGEHGGSSRAAPSAVTSQPAVVSQPAPSAPARPPQPVDVVDPWE